MLDTRRRKRLPVFSQADTGTEIVLQLCAIVLLVAIMWAAEMRLTPEERIDLFNATYSAHVRWDGDV
jgi:hypothetical protein